METLSDDWDNRDDQRLIPEVITFIPVIENKFGPDGAEAKKIIHGGYLKLEKVHDIKFSKRYYVFGELF